MKKVRAEKSQGKKTNRKTKTKCDKSRLLWNEYTSPEYELLVACSPNDESPKDWMMIIGKQNLFSVIHIISKRYPKDKEVNYHVTPEANDLLNC